MIFLKKIYELAAILAALVLFTGCADNSGKKSDKAADKAEVSYEADEDITENLVDSAEDMTTVSESPTLPADIEAAEGTYIYDTANILSDEQFKSCNDYIETLYENYLLNAAVVTANDLGGASAEEYAAKMYTELYNGLGSGLLLLINNDTNEDYLYRTGSCATYVTDDAVKQTFYWATQDMVADDWQSAILRLMQLGEGCPSHIFDNASVFSAEEITEIENTLKGYKNNVSVLATTNNSERTDEDILNDYYERHCKDGSGYMLMLDTATNTVIVKSGSELPSDIESTLKTANDAAAKGTYKAAVLAAAEKLKG